MLLNAQSDIDVVGEAVDGRDVTRKARELKPDVCLLDLSMPGPRSGNVIRGVLEASPKTRVLVLTMHDDAAYLRSALAAGASGYLVKKAADSELMSAVRAVHAGRTFVDLTDSVGGANLSRSRKSPGEGQRPKKLSAQERRTLQPADRRQDSREREDGGDVSYPAQRKARPQGAGGAVSLRGGIRDSRERIRTSPAALDAVL